MGQIKRRGRVYWVRYYRDGRRFEESSGSTKETDARRLLRLREGDIERGVPVTPKLGRLTFDEAVAMVVADYQMNKRDTLADVQRRVDKHLRPFFGGRNRMIGITTDRVTTYSVDRQNAGASNAEINRELAILKRAFSLAVKAGKLMMRPHIPMLKEGNARKGFFEREEFQQVRKLLPEPLQPLITFAYLTGWRKEEVLSLEWRHVNFDAGEVRLEPGETKNDDGRTFPFGDMLPELRDLLTDQLKERKRVERKQGIICRFVFHRNGKQIRDYYDAWHTACHAAGLSGRIPHDFRRTAVRNLVRAGVPEKTAMLLTGHKTRAVFDRYDIVNKADLSEAVRKLGAVAGTISGTVGKTGRVRQLARRSVARVS